ncbi:mob1 family protein [Stemphylium lycopersici]|uniref:Mob1 family protein n=1 Tax=Stemphylium lycopersici TaxID=183478 RepID=A0A364NCT5_STELY|nr:mob1 family protein [Stemphylium lycopersici]RAR14901.1 mob1 family protein [Stemphylium lycopersici]
MTSPASPRLPSPPPIPEDQLSPISASPEQQKLFSNLDHAAERRIRPGTKATDMAEGPPLVDLSEIDSAFQLTEHLKALHNFLTHPVGANSTIPVDREMALKIAHPPENVDRTLWLYELCRFLIQKVNSIITALFSDSPPCSSLTCPEMRASEWQYLCAVHDPPKSCCAIDYCCHTLDWAANTLTSPKHFPSRLALGSDQSTQHSQMRQLTNIFRRVYRIFAHAWYSHRDVFWNVEGRTGLYIFYKTVCDVYGLVPEDNYTIPPEAEGIEPNADPKPSAPPQILKREPSDSGPQASDNTLAPATSDNTLSTAGTTKRHRHSPSVGATIVHTVVEENEDEDERPNLNARPVTQIFESAAEGEAGDGHGDGEEEDEEDDEEEDSDGDVTAIEDHDEDENEADAEVAETTPSESKEIDDNEKQGTSDEKDGEPAPKKEDESVDDNTAESASADTSKAEASGEPGPEKEAPQEESNREESKATEEQDKPAVAESEQVDKPDPAAKPLDKDREPKSQTAE